MTMHRLLGISVAACSLWTNIAVAAPISGTGDPTLDAALAGGTVVDFESVAAGSYPSLTVGGVTFSGVGAPLDVGTDFAGSFNTRGRQSMFTNFDLDPDAIRIDFADTTSAFGFLWGAADNTWDLRAFDSGNNLIESFAIAPVFGSNAGDYFGIQANGIAYATLTDRLDTFTDGDYVFIDNFTYVSGNRVPEPGTLALLGGGLLLAVGRRRSKTPR